MDKSILNSFAFTAFRRLDDGSWVLSDPARWGRILPTREYGLALRRRMLIGWLAAFAIAAGVSLATGDQDHGVLVIALAPAVMLARVASAARALPRSDYRFTRHELWYQMRGYLAAFAVLSSVLAAACVVVFLMIADPFLLDLTAILALAAASAMLLFWHVSTRSGATAKA